MAFLNPSLLHKQQGKLKTQNLKVEVELRMREVYIGMHKAVRILGILSTPSSCDSYQSWEQQKQLVGFRGAP